MGSIPYNIVYSCQEIWEMDERDEDRVTTYPETLAMAIFSSLNAIPA